MPVKKHATARTAPAEDFQTAEGFVKAHAMRAEQDAILVNAIAWEIRKACDCDHNAAVIAAGNVISGWYAKGVR